MQSTNSNSNAINSFNFSTVTPEDLKVIQQAEDQLNQNKKDKIILIAYDGNAQ